MKITRWTYGFYISLIGIILYLMFFLLNIVDHVPVILGLIIWFTAPWLLIIGIIYSIISHIRYNKTIDKESPNKLEKRLIKLGYILPIIFIIITLGIITRAIIYGNLFS